MGRKEDNIKRATEVMHILPQIRNLCIAAHIDHGKTTLSDNLIAGAGMMSEDLAGKSRVLDFDEQERAQPRCTRGLCDKDGSSIDDRAAAVNGMRKQCKVNWLCLHVTFCFYF